MPLTGEYEPSTSDWARKQMEQFEGSGGTKGNTLRGMPIIVMTSIGAQSGKLRKTPLMRVEYEGEYAAVASLGGAPKHPVWYYNLKKNPHVELQDGPVKKDYLARGHRLENRQASRLPVNCASPVTRIRTLGFPGVTDGTAESSACV